MKILLNGQAKEFADSISLKNIIEQFCQETRPVIAEVNGEIIKRYQWKEKMISAGDTIELVNLVGGG